MAYGGARRLSGRGLLGGFGLLALVLTIAIMAMVAMRVLDSSPVASDGASPTVLEPVGGAVGSQPGASVAPSPTGGSASAQLAACHTDRSTLELANSAYETLHGKASPDQATLVTEGLLATELSTYRFEAPGEIVGTGQCAGF